MAAQQGLVFVESTPCKLWQIPRPPVKGRRILLPLSDEQHTLLYQQPVGIFSPTPTEANVSSWLAALPTGDATLIPGASGQASHDVNAVNQGGPLDGDNADGRADDDGISTNSQAQATDGEDAVHQVQPVRRYPTYWNNDLTDIVEAWNKKYAETQMIEVFVHSVTLLSDAGDSVLNLSAGHGDITQITITRLILPENIAKRGARQQGLREPYVDWLLIKFQYVEPHYHSLDDVPPYHTLAYPCDGFTFCSEEKRRITVQYPETGAQNEVEQTFTTLKAGLHGRVPLVHGNVPFDANVQSVAISNWVSSACAKGHGVIQLMSDADLSLIGDMVVSE